MSNSDEPLIHVLDPRQFDRARLDDLCSLTTRIRQLAKSRLGARALQTLLPHKRAMLYFTQPSTRTYLSFENACHLLGIRTAEIRDPSTSSEFKGESFEDSLRTFSSYVDIIIMRTWGEGLARQSADLMDRIRRPVPIINAGSGKDAHPTQALLDVYTLERSLEKRGGIDGKTIGFMGDLKRGRTARSLCYLMQRYRDVRLLFIAPDAFQMAGELLDWLDARDVAYSCTDRLHEVLGELDALYVTRLQKEYDTGGESDGFDHARFSVGPRELELLPEGSIVMHPLPRGPELDPVVDDDPRAMYWRQERNGMWIRVALLVKIFGVEEDLPERATGVSADMPPVRRRVPITAIAVIGLGALVAVTVGGSLYLGLASATENTRRLMAQGAETLVDSLERRLESQLQPVAYQARWMVDQIERGDVKLDDPATIDAFLLGGLSATQRLSGLGIVNSKGQIRGWENPSKRLIVDDWSDRPQVIEWLNEVASRTGPAWQAPSWAPVLEETIVRHDTPIRIEGAYEGIFSQAVSVSDLSRYLASAGARTGNIPFILYDRNYVLAHPWLMDWSPDPSEHDQPLVMLHDLGDPVLERIWTPDEQALFLLEDMSETSASGASVGDEYYVFLYRDLLRYGPAPWTIGVYVDVGTSDVLEWLGQIVRSILTGAFHERSSEGDEFERLVASALVGLAVFVGSVVLAAWFGTRASRPVKAIAAAARSVELQRFDRIEELPPSRVVEFDDANRSFNRMVAGLKERELIRETLGRFVPADVARTLLSEGGELTPRQSEATVLFCDLAGFTSLTETLGADGIVPLLNEYFESMVEILERHRGVVTQFQGDAILATFNVPVADSDHSANALRAAIDMRSVALDREFEGHRVANRIGVNTGQVVAGAVGAKGRLSYTVHGDAVNLAARLEALNKELGTSILVSASTAACVEGFDLRPMGEVSVRGQTERVAVYTLGARES